MLLDLVTPGWRWPPPVRQRGAPTGWGRRRTIRPSAAIASSTRSGLRWTYSARYSANDAMTRAPRRASSGSTASAQLETEGVCVDILRSLCRDRLRLPEVCEEKTAGRATRRGESAALRAIRTRRDCDFFWRSSPQIGRKATSGAVDAGGERPGRVWVSPASHSSHCGAPVRGGKPPVLPRELSTSVPPWSSGCAARSGVEGGKSAPGCIFQDDDRADTAPLSIPPLLQAFR
jgi:hypothetical protein